MPIPPRSRQNTRGMRRDVPSRDDAQRSLVHAFATFTQAADSLEKSHAQLQTEVARLSGERERANPELTKSLEENSCVRVCPAKILERLPCGVLVFDVGTRAARHQPGSPPFVDARSFVAAPPSDQRLPQRRSCTASSMACSASWGIPRPLPPRFFRAIVRRVSICAACWSPSCRASWSLPRWKFPLGVTVQSLGVIR